VEVEEGAEASVSPKVATAEVTGGGRGRQAMAVAIQIASEIERERGATGGCAGSVDQPRPEPGWLGRARVGRLSQQASWAK
jgi:hypothetical protein